MIIYAEPNYAVMQYDTLCYNICLTRNKKMFFQITYPANFSHCCNILHCNRAKMTRTRRTNKGNALLQNL